MNVSRAGRVVPESAPVLAEAAPVLAESAPADTPLSRPRRTQAERRATTRAAIVAAARELFGAQGYADAALDEVVRRAGVTRGALYHHFESKADLFAAVVKSVDEEFAEEVVMSARAGNGAVDAIHRGARAYVDACARSSNARILADVSSVLGPEAYEATSSDSCLALMRQGIETVVAEGGTVPGDPAVLAAMLLGALNQAVLLMARNLSSAAVRDSVTVTVDAVLARLLGTGR